MASDRRDTPVRAGGRRHGWREDFVDEPVRTCALDGCVETIGSVHGRPQRLYCSAAHRLAARRVRRAAAQATGDDRATETLPWLREPGPAHVPVRPVRPAGGSPEGGRARRTGAAPGAAPVPARLCAPRTPLRHRRTLALIGATAVLLGGYALTTTPRSVDGAPAAQERTADEWASRARVTLTSLDEQLGTLASTERTWARSPHATGNDPAAVGQLRRQRDTLRQQRAALQSQLDAYASRPDAVDALAAADRQLAELDRIVAELPPPARRTTGQVAAATSLEEQRDLRARRRDACAEELEGIDDSVERARTAPLPEDRSRTDAVSGDVLALARGAEPPAPEPSGPRQAPQVLAGGRETGGDRERDDVGTSGPPDPRGPVDETAPRAEGPAGGSGRGAGSRPDGDRGAAPRAAAAKAGPGETLGGAVSDAADGVASLTGGKSDDGRRPGRGGTASRSGGDDRRQGPGSGARPGEADGPVRKIGAGAGAAARGVGDTAEGLGSAVDGLTGGGERRRSGGGGDADRRRSGDGPSAGDRARADRDGDSRRGRSGSRAPDRAESTTSRAAELRVPEPRSDGSGTGSRSGGSGSGSGSGSRGIASAVAGSYVEAAMGKEAAAPVLAEADRQAAEQMAERSGRSSGGGSTDSGGSRSGSDSGGGRSAEGSGGRSGDGSGRSRSAGASERGGSDDGSRSGDRSGSDRDGSGRSGSDRGGSDRGGSGRGDPGGSDSGRGGSSSEDSPGSSSGSDRRDDAA